MGRNVGQKLLFGCFLCIMGILLPFTAAADMLPVDGSRSLYGDAGEVSWEKIAPHLPAPYSHTEFITVMTLNGSRSFYFNLEMFLDKGFLVYGDPYSTALLGYQNDFREKEGGYFIDQGVRGEYRYLGITYMGTVYSNAEFPSDAGSSSGLRLKMIRYSELPAALKNAYGVGASGNTAFLGARELIDAAGSPCLDFTNTSTLWGTITLRQSLAMSGLEGASVYEYGYINSWGAGGGSIRFFYQGVDDPDVYRYATFAGPVSAQWQKVFEGLSGKILTYNGLFPMEVFLLMDGQEYIDIEALIQGIFVDKYDLLDPYEKLFTYTRADNPVYGLRLASSDRSVAECRKTPDSVIFSSERETLRFYRDDLQKGLNYIPLQGTVHIAFGEVIFSAEVKKTICIRVMSALPPRETAEPSPEPTPVPTPKAAPDLVVRRRW